MISFMICIKVPSRTKSDSYIFLLLLGYTLDAHSTAPPALPPSYNYQSGYILINTY